MPSLGSTSRRSSTVVFVRSGCRFKLGHRVAIAMVVFPASAATASSSSPSIYTTTTSSASPTTPSRSHRLRDGRRCRYNRQHRRRPSFLSEQLDVGSLKPDVTADGCYCVKTVDVQE
ncbi:uncharacterized protein LOC119305656 isoform X2 [Triticum dicoccoides]|uniref:uncharacterized protein LOC119305656 isoform X2 n=1 Tax=Triticum dicoccoides TaxID=85692 RepID=UPI00188FD14A|nr:uncharacterized protein LOC119305656 isoform X2 [Triticum dicoccoides]